LIWNNFKTKSLKKFKRVEKSGGMRGREVDVSHKVKVRGDGGERREDEHVTIGNLICGERQWWMSSHVSLEKRELWGSGEIFLERKRWPGEMSCERQRDRDRDREQRQRQRAETEQRERQRQRETERERDRERETESRDRAEIERAERDREQRER
jgi:hypothetical protein